MRAASGSTSAKTRPDGGTDPLLIAVEHLTKYYGTTRAVDDVSFTVPRGEVAALLGPNGSGKSTVMRILTGYFSPTAGRVCVGGVDVASRPVAARRQVGYLPEQVMLYPELSVRRYLTFVAGVKGLAGGEVRRGVGEALERCALGDMADRPAGTLSKGYRQRVGLAQALLGDPEVLVLDEPTVGLDPVQTLEMRGLVRGLAGRTVLFSTHVLSEASAVCSRVIILARGQLLAEDTAAGLGRRLTGPGRIMVRVDGPAEAVGAALGELAGVERLERPVPDGQPGVAWDVIAVDTEVVRRAIAGAIVARGWTLLELHVAVPTLEDLFVRVLDAAQGMGS